MWVGVTVGVQPAAGRQEDRVVLGSVVGRVPGQGAIEFRGKQHGQGPGAGSWLEAGSWC